MSIDSIDRWHKRARPNPLTANFNVQLGCHFEELAEMIAVLTARDPRACDLLDGAHTAVNYLAIVLKQGRYQVEVTDRQEFLDSLCDQIVTAVGVGHCAKMDIVEATKRVDDSNWSKYDENGLPVFNDHGKIQKGPHYAPPVLDGLY